MGSSSLRSGAGGSSLRSGAGGSALAQEVKPATGWTIFGCRSFILYYRVFLHKITDYFPFHQIKFPQKCLATQKVCPCSPNRKHSDCSPYRHGANFSAANCIFLRRKEQTSRGPRYKLPRALQQNNFRGLEIYFRGTEIYFKGFEINFQATEKVSLHVATENVQRRKELVTAKDGSSHLIF